MGCCCTNIKDYKIKKENTEEPKVPERYYYIYIQNLMI